MAYFKREIETECRSMAKQYPVLTITGPRQSGKTTLVRHLFHELPYFSFENPDIRMLMQTDPRRFLAEIPHGAVLDEIQHVPELTSYLQQMVDGKKKQVNFILTGSNQFMVMQHVTQSLAGRTALLTLLPLTIRELSTKTSGDPDQLMYHGFYPAIWARNLNPTKTYRNYYETYLQRDVRQLIRLKDQSLFHKFMGICAGRTGSLFNASSVATEVGVSVPTIKSWLSILEASFVILLLQPWHENLTSRLVKTPKLYFYDTGLAAYLLGIEKPEQLKRDPLRGMLFENMVIMELVKRRYNKGLNHSFYFYRDNHQNEIDLLYRKGNDVICIEIKSSETFHTDFLRGFSTVDRVFGSRVKRRILIYNGSLEQHGEIEVVNFRNADLF